MAGVELNSRYTGLSLFEMSSFCKAEHRVDHVTEKHDTQIRKQSAIFGELEIFL
jgi:hypothetical protein